MLPTRVHPVESPCAREASNWFNLRTLSGTDFRDQINTLDSTTKMILTTRIITY